MVNVVGLTNPNGNFFLCIIECILKIFWDHFSTLLYKLRY